jgi:hypothetical protein
MFEEYLPEGFLIFYSRLLDADYPVTCTLFAPFYAEFLARFDALLESWIIPSTTGQDNREKTWLALKEYVDDRKNGNGSFDKLVALTEAISSLQIPGQPKHITFKFVAQLFLNAVRFWVEMDNVNDAAIAPFIAFYSQMAQQYLYGNSSNLALLDFLKNKAIAIQENIGGPRGVISPPQAEAPPVPVMDPPQAATAAANPAYISPALFAAGTDGHGIMPVSVTPEAAVAGANTVSVPASLTAENTLS